MMIFFLFYEGVGSSPDIVHVSMVQEALLAWPHNKKFSIFVQDSFYFKSKNEIVFGLILQFKRNNIELSSYYMISLKRGLPKIMQLMITLITTLNQILQNSHNFIQLLQLVIFQIMINSMKKRIQKIPKWIIQS